MFVHLDYTLQSYDDISYIKHENGEIFFSWNKTLILGFIFVHAANLSHSIFISIIYSNYTSACVLLTVNICTLQESELTASQSALWLRTKLYILANSFPLLTYWIISPVLVSKTLTWIPFYEVVTSFSPSWLITTALKTAFTICYLIDEL